MRQPSIVAVVSLFLASPALAAQVVYVDHAATGANDGTSWSDAYTSLRVALDAATAGEELWVASGTYLPGPTAQMADSFVLKNGVALYGGFAGGETSLAQRDWLAHPTILSGDVGQDDVYGSPWWNGWNIGTANSAQVVTASFVDATAILDGFVVRDGSTGPSGTPAGSWEMFAGGVMCKDASPTIVHCTFEYNLAAFGSGSAIYVQDGSPTLRDCVFRHNWVHLGSGAVHVAGASQPVIEDCLFFDNFATTGSGGQEAQGAGLTLGWNLPPITVLRCTFDSNSAQQFSAGGGIEQARGGGLSSFSDGLVVRECVFRRNRANAGGALYVWGSATIVDSLFVENDVFNCVVGGTTVSGYGSAIGATNYWNDPMLVVGCTVVKNRVVTGEAGAVFGGGTYSIAVHDSILWGNSAPAPASTRQANYKGNVALAHSCVEGLFAPDPNDPPPQQSDVPGCIEANPQFTSYATLDLRLAAGSPCVDSGSNALLPGTAELDLDGHQRVWQGASSFTVDMGAYEFGSPLPPACPSIVIQPLSKSVGAGTTASLDVLATGVAPSYRWRKANVALDDDGHFSGTHTATLTVHGLIAADAGSYDCVVSNGCGSITSNAATLTVVAPPLGTVFCSGDGSVVGCPCGNDKDVGMGCENSTGEGAALRATGTPSLAADDALLTASDMPNNKSVLVFVGTNKTGGGYGIAFGDGLLCTVPIHRFTPGSTGASGTFSLASPVAKANGKLHAGTTYHFQAWFRDPNGPCGSTYNTSNALSITYTP
ncbi:MAG: right-handed parallel beta-helix repeat-containing protein [Planctomycetes bacterium]|nr:right-handed parallel beta-helix repeat-containing protein [Planctomycetota bacterium]